MLWKYVCVSCVLKKFDKIDKSHIAYRGFSSNDKNKASLK